MASWPVWASLAANAFLFCAKLLVWEQARSLAVAASLLDSTLDLLAQAALAFAAHGAQRPDSRYPVGKARLEASAVVVVSCVFAVGAATVATHCVERLSKGKNAKVPHIQTNDFVLLTLVVVVKLVLFVVCFGFLRRQKKADPQGSLSPALTAITADHAADVLTNAAALLAACLASPPFRLNTHTSRPNTHTTLQRLADPVGGLCISLFVLLGWSWQAWHTICKLVGVRCSREKYDTIKTVIETFREELLCEENLSEALHDDAYLYDAYPPSPKSSVTNPGFAIDTIRAYHGGENVVVEVEIVMPATTTLLEAHDVGLRLQLKIEHLDFVERAFVHADYDYRQTPEHFGDLRRHESDLTQKQLLVRRTTTLGSNVSLRCDENETPEFDTVAARLLGDGFDPFDEL